MKIDLSSKTALVTGGSKGIGKGVARSLSEAGAHVFICARELNELEETVAEISHKTGTPVKAIQADITSQDEVDSLMETIRNHSGGVDILVNNVGGIGRQAAFEEIDAEEYLSLYDLNVVTMIRLVKAVAPGMKERRWGRIINMSSENGLQPYPDMIPYNLTKAAIINLSKGLSKLYGKFNILVNTVSPAFIYTPLVDSMLRAQADDKGISKEEAQHRFLEQNRPGIELGRSGTIEEVGAAVAFLASEQASFITGTNLRVDGGSVSTI
ncbi:SDR family NAD(P)-dependent oxidoreductase [Arcticibacter tournemirensis]|uniref:SDR family oxidoreductase n=1 Tax=Arcticibacter tournemirensis TaxID=699437 RepID=A0A4Q0M9C3_9SPHI|nr:SDR family oxidoreductase [Arcticibacter tournemirensis]RXF69791.1 SDR family oxidoreductase [Arcticibacter tournemirensis]